jgi:hypothetical protein
VRVGYSNLLSLAPPLRGISLIGTAVGPEALAEEPRPDRLTRAGTSGEPARPPKIAELLSPDPSQAVNHPGVVRKGGAQGRRARGDTLKMSHGGGRGRNSVMARNTRGWLRIDVSMPNLAPLP